MIMMTTVWVMNATIVAVLLIPTNLILMEMVLVMLVTFVRTFGILNN